MKDISRLYMYTDRWCSHEWRPMTWAINERSGTDVDFDSRQTGACSGRRRQAHLAGVVTGKAFDASTDAPAVNR